MPRAKRTTSARRILAAAEPALMARLQPLLPHATIEDATIERLATTAAHTSPQVVLCAPADPVAGLAALRQLLSIRTGSRSLFVTPAAAAEERLAALEAGVDDVVATPVTDTELAGRLSLLLRRAGATRARRMAIGRGMTLDLDRRELLRGDEWVHLRPKEAGLLELLARSPGRTITREHILERVWGREHAGDQRTVDVHVRWLRAKVEPDPRRPQHLITVRGVGYRLEPEALTEC